MKYLVLRIKVDFGTALEQFKTFFITFAAVLVDTFKNKLSQQHRKSENSFSSNSNTFCSLMFSHHRLYEKNLVEFLLITI